MSVTIGEPVSELPPVGRYERLPHVWSAVLAASPQWVPVRTADAPHAVRVAKAAANRGFQTRRVGEVVYIRRTRA